MSAETKTRLQQACKIARFNKVYWNGNPPSVSVCRDYLAEHLDDVIGRFCRAELTRIETGEYLEGEDGLTEVVSDAITETLYVGDVISDVVNVDNPAEVFSAVMHELGCTGYDNDRKKRR